MATYYIRKTGSDAAAGTSAGAAWLTIGKALGASGIASGDTVWIGAGVYREVVSVAMTSATVETFIKGDVTGANTGDAGEVQWTGYTVHDMATPSTSSNLDMNGRDFLTFQDIVFQQGGGVTIAATTANTVNLTLLRCKFKTGKQGAAGNHLALNTTANVASNIVIDSCIFYKGSNNCLTFTLTRPATADFNYNILIKTCLFTGGGGSCVNVTATGANTFNGGGVDMYNCYGNTTLMNILTANISTTIPCHVYNCYGDLGNTGILVATTLGQIIEDYNILLSGPTPRTNVTAGAHSVSDGSIAALLYMGHEFYSVGSNLMPFGMPKPGSPLLGFGNQAGSPTVDILGAPKPSGTILKLATGTATSGAAKTITDSGKTFGTNALAGATIKIISGTGSGQTKSIASNTATVITVDGNWKTNPDNTSVYEVYKGAMSTSGTATSGSTTTLVDSNAAWGVNQWQGYTLKTDTGTGSGQTIVVTSNTSTTLTFPAATALDNTTTYRLYKGTDENTINPSVGCYELSNTAVQETGTVRTGSNAISIAGAGYHDFNFPVDATSTTITVYTQFDSAYSGTKPSMNIVNGGECGVANATSTAVGSSGSWEQLTLTFTPTAKGIVTIRLVSSTTTPTGNAFFDDFNVT